MSALLSSTTILGCTSIQWLDAAGRPRSFGFATIAPSATDETITRIVAPGPALRLIPGLVGYSIGWRETVLFQSSCENRELVAFADRVYGIALDSTQITVGTARQFAVLKPSTSTDVIQEIRYVAANPAASRLVRQEMK